MKKNFLFIFFIIIFFQCLSIFAFYKENYSSLERIYNAGKEFYKDNNFKFSETLLEKYLSGKKEFLFSNDAIFFNAENKYYLEKYKNSVNSYLSILEQYPDTKIKYKEEIYFKIAACYFKLKNYDESVKYTDFIITQFKNSKFINDAYLLKAENLFILNDYEEALNTLNKIEQQSNYKYLDYVYYLLGRIYYEKIFNAEKKDKKEFAEKSISYFNKIKKEFPDSKILNYVYFREANVYYAMEEYNKAILLINELLKIEDDIKVKNILKYYLAWNYYMIKDYNRSLQIYDEILSNLSDDILGIWAKYKKGLCFEALNETEKAIQQYKRVLTENPNTVPSAFSEYALAYYHYKNSDYSESLYMFQNIIEKYEIEDLKKAAYYMLGEINIKMQRYIAARQIYEEIKIKFPSEQYIAQHLIAWCLSKEGEYKKAIDIYNELLKSDFSYELKLKTKLKIADNYYELNMLEEAGNIYNEIIKEKKDYPDIAAEAYYARGWIFYKRENYNEAKKMFEYAKQIAFSKDLKTRSKFMIANMFYCDYKFNDALYIYQDILKESDVDEEIKSESIFYSALCYYRKEEFDNAIRLWKEYEIKVKDRVKKAESIFRIGWSYFRMNQFQQAIDTFERIIKDFKETHYYQEALLKTGDCYYNSGQYEKAILQYKNLVERYPDHYAVPDALYGVQWSYYQMGQYDKAIELSKEFVEKYKRSNFAPEIKYRIAEHYYNVAKYETAIKEFSEFIEKYPENNLCANAYYWLGISYYNLSKFYEAAGVLKELLKKYPDTNFYDKAVFKLGTAYYKLREYNAAIENFKIIIEKYGDSKYIDDAYFNIAMAYKRLGNVEEAKNWYSKLIEKGKNLKLIERALMNSGYIYQDEKNYDEAVKYFKKVVAMNMGKSAEAQFWIGDSYQLKGDLNKAAEEYLNLYKNFKNEQVWVIPALDAAGKIYESKGNLKKAISTYKKILNVTKEKKYVDYAKKKIELLKEQQKILNPAGEPTKINNKRK